MCPPYWGYTAPASNIHVLEMGGGIAHDCGGSLGGLKDVGTFYVKHHRKTYQH